MAERMKIRGLSQAELARRVGVSQPTIFKLIHENKSGSRVLHLVAKELETTPDYLSGETDDPEGEAVSSDYTAQEREWIELLRALPLADRKATMHIVRSLANCARSANVIA